MALPTASVPVVRPQNRDGFQIAIICALTLEADMVELILDENWTLHKYGKAPGDKNTYTLGSIAGHPIVLAACPRMGGNDAAAVAARISSSFTGIKLAFLVGICGAVPVHPSTKEHIFLGDCIISTAVVQYDMGRQYPGGFQIRKSVDSLGPTSSEIRAFTAMLSTRLTRRWLNDKLNHNLQDLQTEYPDVRRPPAENDRLYNPSYVHGHQPLGRQCGRCQKDVGVCLLECHILGCKSDQIVLRDQYQRNVARIHFGIFGSANAVMKSGLHRDVIAEAEELSAFEMEGSGVWEAFPTIIIKSACDYADSHKSKAWQEYCAASAAACLKAVLERLELPEQHPVTHDYTQSRTSADDLTPLLQALSSQGSYQDIKDSIIDRAEGTCEWFLSQDAFREWLKRSGGLLLVSADPGCGKSVLAKYLVNKQLPRLVKGSMICYYFFKDVVQDTLAPALCALLHQLYTADYKLLHRARETYKQIGEHIKHDVATLFDLLLDAGCNTKCMPIIIVLDALDECKEDDRRRLFQFLTRVQQSEEAKDNLKFLITSRPYHNIVSNYGTDVVSNRLHVPGENESDAISQEIDLVIQQRLTILSKENKISDEVRLELEKRLLNESHRTYLWVYLLFDELENTLKKTSREVHQLFKSLPRNVNEAYEKILTKSQDDDIQHNVFRIMCAILSAVRPLTVQEMQCIVKVGLSPRTQYYSELDLETEEDFAIKMRNWCGLFINIYEGCVYLIHQTAREFLIAETITLGRPHHSIWKWHGSISVEEAHMTMARLCLAYIPLCCEGTREQQVIENTDWFSFWPPITNIPFPLLRYAAAFWDHHLYMSRPLLDIDTLNQASLICVPKDSRHSIWFPLRFPWRIRPSTELGTAAALKTCAVVEFLLAKCDYKPDAYPLAEALDMAYKYRSCDHKLNLLLGCWSTNANSFCEMPLNTLFDSGERSMVRRLLEKFGDAARGSSSPENQRAAILLDLLFGDREDEEEEQNANYLPIRVESRFVHNKCWQTQKWEVVKNFLRDPPGHLDTELKNTRGMTSLLSAAACGWIWAVKVLAGYGANIDYQDHDQRTAMHHALIDKTIMTIQESGAIIKTLLDRGANPNILSDGRISVLMLAVGRGSLEIVRLLLENHADPNLQDKDGQTPLHLAFDPRIARALLRHGANPSLRNIHGTAAETIGGWQSLERTIAYRARPDRPRSPVLHDTPTRRARSPVSHDTPTRQARPPVPHDTPTRRARSPVLGDNPSRQAGSPVLRDVPVQKRRRRKKRSWWL